LIEYVGNPDYLQGIGNHIAYGSYDLFFEEVSPGSGLWRDDFGVTWDRTRGKTDFGVVAGRALPESALTGFQIPPLNEARLRRCFEVALAGMRDECPVADVGWGLFERAWTLRGMEDLLIDMVTEPSFVEELTERIAAHQQRVVEIALDYPFDLVLFGDDWGQQQGLILSPAHWRRYLKPHFARMFALVKQAGKRVALHSCGNIGALFPELIEIGLDVYQTFQPEVYDIRAIKREYGQDLSFWGGISTQRVLPFGTPAEVRRSVRETMRVLGVEGGYIAGPTHAVPPGVPPENLVALVEACQEQ